MRTKWPTPLGLFDRLLIEHRHGRRLTLTAMHQVLLGQLLLVPHRLLVQLVGLPQPGKTSAPCRAKHQGQQVKPPAGYHQISTCAARL